MITRPIWLLLFLFSVVGLARTETEFERIDAFHALGKCSHQKCAGENKKMSEAIEKTGDFQAKMERCAKCRTKPYEELSDDEKRTLISCIKENECDTISHLREKYKDSDEFKRLVKCLQENCPAQYNAVTKYKQWIVESSTDSAKAE